VDGEGEGEGGAQKVSWGRVKNELSVHEKSFFTLPAQKLMAHFAWPTLTSSTEDDKAASSD
jgi:hypothetical protein